MRKKGHAAWGALFAVGCIVGGAHIDPSLDDDDDGTGGMEGDDQPLGGSGGISAGSAGRAGSTSGRGGTVSGGGPSGGNAGDDAGTSGGGTSGKGGGPSGGVSGSDKGGSGGRPGGAGGASAGSLVAGQGGIAGKGGTGGIAGASGGGIGGTAGIGGLGLGGLGLGGLGLGGLGLGGSPGGSAGFGGTIPTSGTGGSGGVNIDPQCMGIKSNMACIPEGQQCPNLTCGLGDVGRRECNCATNWACSSCNWAGTVLETKPPNAETPCTGAGEFMPCATAPGMASSVCRSTVIPTEYCMCAVNPRAPVDPPEWDCDAPPSSW